MTTREIPEVLHALLKQWRVNRYENDKAGNDLSVEAAEARAL